MSDIGVIGLGVMGRPMARNLLAAGHRVTVHNRSQQVVDALVEEGAGRADSPAEVAQRCEIVLTCLPDSPDVERVVLGDDGVLAGASQGGLLIDTSTIRPDTARAVAERGRALGVDVIDAPVSGGEQGAIDGTLSVMCGGEDAAFERARPVLEAIGRTIVHVGPPGSGQTVKAANQMLVAGILQLVSEAIVLVEASGIDPERAVEVLSGGLAGNRILDAKAAGMLDRSFAPGFRAELHHKDLGIALAALREQGVAAPATGLVAQLMAGLLGRGRGHLDHSALLTLVDELSGHGGGDTR